MMVSYMHEDDKIHPAMIVVREVDTGRFSRTEAISGCHGFLRGRL